MNIIVRHIHEVKDDTGSVASHIQQFIKNQFSNLKSQIMNELENLQAQIATLQASVDDTQGKYQKAIDDLEVSNKALTDANTAANAAIATLQAANTDLQNQIANGATPAQLQALSTTIGGVITDLTTTQPIVGATDVPPAPAPAG